MQQSALLHDFLIEKAIQKVFRPEGRHSSFFRLQALVGEVFVLENENHIGLITVMMFFIKTDVANCPSTSSIVCKNCYI